ncbi:hypothetical protein P168DRAFT_293437 [Aspergillus campestris IBT 28561]|uniref:Uncharacterized protein n=1 Tax=Aspergillus campestris (strain IBT 28561) TaxID=1392248 RepID=A0A2I1CSI2_ASPC2|nr:uncharacterized protein P168DRAFT_293437 [Aspergillus campestris IBT 28561]PKY00574.1 hypothetical protein P168DRAFT_293437 [Aspergillus campestris IBT 28561]
MEYIKRLIGRETTAASSNPQPTSSKPPQPRIMADPLLCSRSETVRKLATILDEEQVVHVRGTPASGKSTLAKLLHSHNRQNHIPSVLIHARDAGLTSVTPDTIRDTDVTFLIDEAQMSYEDYGLWLDFIKTQNGRRYGPRICLFTSYGSPSEGPDNYPTGSPLTYLGVQQRISITPSKIRGSPQISLFYTRSEFDDVVQRICTDGRRPVPLHRDAADYIFSLTNGHPGAVYSVLDMIYQVHRSEIKHGKIREVGKDHIITMLDDEEESFRILGQSVVKRSFVDRRRLSHHAADTLREVLKNGSVQRDLSNDGIRNCYESGWLHSEPLDADASSIVCVFPTRLHAKYVEHYLTASLVSFPIQRYPTIGDLSEAALRRFSLRNLSSITRVGTGAVVRPVEACYQDEFYRCLHEVLGFSSNVSSEWSGGGNGRIDFRIADLAWGIELLRDGDRLDAHCSRFVDNGSYTRWIEQGELRDWLIIDCRTSPPRPYNVPGTKLWRAVFAVDFSSIEVLDASNNVVIPRFPLMS